MNSRLINLCILPARPLREAIELIDKNQKGIVLIVDEKQKLINTITDGDIRRSFLMGQSFDASVKDWLQQRPDKKKQIPITAFAGTVTEELLNLMKKHSVRQIPVLDQNSKVIDLVTLEELLPEETAQLQAVILAGGRGSRLRPLTTDVPKSMLPLGEDPILKRIIKQLRYAGIKQINISTHYKSEKIKEYFGDGKELGINLHYLTEDTPLGTAGSLGLIENLKEPLLVINGDILTKINFRSMIEFHREHGADMTMAVRAYDVKMNYGIVETEGVYVKSIREKPKIEYFVNAGIYLLEPSLQKLIPAGERFDMTDLIQKLLQGGKKVASFPMREYWLDIGNPEDYKLAQADIKKKKV